MASAMKPVWQVLLLAVWINVAETVRWVLYSQSRFERLYRSLGLELPNGPFNLFLWVIWGVAIAVIVYSLSQTCSLLRTTLITWFAVFVSVWIALWNFAVLPLDVLIVAAPLSLVTVFVAALIARRFQPGGCVPRSEAVSCTMPG